MNARVSEKLAVGMSMMGLALGLASPALADARIEQKTRVQFSGAMGGVVNTLGGKAAREGVVTATAVKGDRKMATHDDTAQLIDLAEEKIYDINLAKKTYKVTTFAELREKMKKAMEQAGEKPEQAEPNEKAPEYEVDFDVKETGKQQQIAGFDARQMVMTITVRQKGKKLEEGGGSVMTADLWLGPKIKALEEEQAFDMRYAEKLRLADLAEARDLAAAMAASPALQQAMKKFQEQKVSMSGTPLRTILTMETVAGAEQAADAGKEKPKEEAETPPTSVSGLFGKLGKKLAGKQTAKSEEGKAGPGGRTKVLTSTTELIKAGDEVASGEVSIPADFKQK
jgi:hypothetical protein